MKNVIFAGVGGIFLPLNLLPLLPVDWWWVRWWEFPRVQLFVVNLIVVALIVAFRCKNPWVWSVAGALVLCALWQAWWVYPFTPLAARQTEDATASADAYPRVCVLAANVLQENRTSSPLIEMIRREAPEVVVLTEVNSWWAEQIAPLELEFREALVHPQPNHYGIVVLSQLPVVESEIRYLVEEEIPSVHLTLELSNGQQVRFIGVHPSPPRPKFSASQRDAELIIVGREIERTNLPTIVAGDVNDVGWSHTTRLFQRISGMLDPRRGRGIYATFHAQYPFARWPLDHLFHTEHFRLVEMRVMPSVGSDHFPLLIELSYEPDKSAQQDPPEPEPDDPEDARDKLQEAREDEAQGNDDSRSRETELEYEIRRSD